MFDISRLPSPFGNLLHCIEVLSHDLHSHYVLAYEHRTRKHVKNGRLTFFVLDHVVVFLVNNSAAVASIFPEMKVSV